MSVGVKKARPDKARCLGCNEDRPIFQGSQTAGWCKDCVHLAPETTTPSIQPVDDGRPRIKFKVGESGNESEESEARGI